MVKANGRKKKQFNHALWGLTLWFQSIRDNAQRFLRNSNLRESSGLVKIFANCVWLGHTLKKLPSLQLNP